MRSVSSKQLAGLGDTESNTFDAVGRPASHSMVWSGTTYAVNYAYNSLGRLDTLTYPTVPGQANRFQVKYGYTDGFLSALQNYTGNTAGTTFWQLTPGVTNMDPWGHVVDETLGTTTAVRIQSAFDAVTSWVGTRQVGTGGSSNNLQSLAYQWDTVGNLAQRQDLKQSLTEVFANDNLNRLQSSTLNGSANFSSVIDATGNITSRTEGGIAYPYTYNTTHKHAVATVGSGANQTSYTYDANGNMATRNGFTLNWSSANLPTTINGAGGVSASFSYGPDRQRKQQISSYTTDGDNGTETTIYVAGLFEVEVTPALTHYKHFIQVPGGSQVIYDIQSVSGVQVTYLTADHLGSGNLLINSAGTVQVNESYSAYGYRRSSNWAGALAANSADYTAIASTTRRGYTEGFHEMLDNVGLIHMNGRVYDPVIGRFISPDPIVAQVGNSQAGNSCSYVQNRPLTLTDPTGLVANNPKPGMPCKDNCNGYGIGLSNVASHNAALAESLGGGFMGTESSGIGMWSPGGSVEGMQGSDPFVAAVMADNQARADSAAVVAAGAARDKAITELLSSPACCDWSTSSGGATGAQDGGSSSGGSEGPSGGAGGATSGGLPDVVVSAQKNPSTPQSLTFDITKPFGLNNLGWPSGQIGWKLGHPSPSGGVILRRSVSRGYVVSNGSLWGQSEGTAIWEAWTVLPGGDAPEPCCDQTSFGFPDKSPPPGSLLFGTFQQSAVFYEGMSVPADFNPASTDPYAGAGPGIPWSYTAPILPAAGGTAPVSRTVPFVFQEGR